MVANTHALDIIQVRTQGGLVVYAVCAACICGEQSHILHAGAILTDKGRHLTLGQQHR